MDNEIIFIAIFLAMLLPVLVWVIRIKNRVVFLKRRGEKVVGTVIGYIDAATSGRKLGGDLYMPTVKFTTLKGKEVTGHPVTGITMQDEITGVFKVYVYYNPANPSEFCIGS